MNLGIVRYNERAWAIDLIGHVKQLATAQHRAVRDAGGEQTIRDNGSILFPDVLLFGDLATARILQGWELKMPDTGIDDKDFHQNAEQKARALGLDSFVLWNVSHARLYGLDKQSNVFVLVQQWDELRDITSRADVQRNRQRWERLAELILGRVNDLLEDGTLEGRQFIEAYKSGGLTQLILANTDIVSEALRQASVRRVRLKSEIELWWQRYKEEYGFEEAYQALAQVNLINWVGKLLFAHVLRERDSRARTIGQINENTTPEEALTLFETLSQTCNFWTIFSDSIGLSILPEAPWSDLRQFNNLLSDLRVGAVAQEQLSKLLEATASVGRRKMRGQYTTPPELARLLVQLCMQDVYGRVLDACCGSGTIPRTALEYKIGHGMPAQAAAASVVAGDLDPQAVQLATFALATPSLINQPLRIFNKDAFTLTPDISIEYRRPDDGALFQEQLGRFHAIASNLPFIAQKGRESYRGSMQRVNQSFADDVGPLPGKADVAAYLPFSLYELLEPGGRFGLIITNAWLGTDWGNAFSRKIRLYYNIKAVVTSGAGRWFQSSKVVTNLVILEKPAQGKPVENNSIEFVVLKRPLCELADAETLSVTASQIELGRIQNETMTIRSVSAESLDADYKLGLAANAQFVDVDWVRDLPLTPVSSLFTIQRGERRGWNNLFYPLQGHGIEPDYIKPVLRNPKAITRYTVTAGGEAFSCSLSLDELSQKGHKGAIAWINKFADGVNTEGKPLVECLAIKGMHWYEMKADDRADFAMPINPGERLFIACLDPPAFLDQRLARFNAKSGVDLDLCHALLNSTIGMFMIEGLGFGRGEGVLDLNKDSIEKFMHMLDPNKLNERSQEEIKNAFGPIKQREIMEVADELEQPDRQHFDAVIIKSFGIDADRNRIYESLLNLVSIRLAATQILKEKAEG